MFTTPIDYHNKNITWATIAEIIGDTSAEEGPYSQFLDVIGCVKMIRKDR